LILYDLIIVSYWWMVRVAASAGHAKAMRAVNYRKEEIAIPKTETATLWIHAASAGEGNQALPLIKHIRESMDIRIVISFFSPSGFDFHIDNPIFDQVVMLPSDTKANAREFIEQIQPDAALFIRNELWFNYLYLLNKKAIPAYLINAPAHILSEQPFYLKNYLKKCLSLFSTIFCVERSDNALSNLSTLIGDTKWEVSLTDPDKGNERLYSFTKGRFCIILGSSYQIEEEILSEWWNKKQENWCLIIAPHDNYPERIREIKNLFPKAIKYSETPPLADQVSDVMILDEYGLLTLAYSYGNIAVVGGGFGSGIHNILEPASNGIPVIFGPKHQKFSEAAELGEMGLAMECEEQEEVGQWLTLLSNETIERKRIQNGLNDLFEEKTGFAKQVANEIAAKLDR